MKSNYPMNRKNEQQVNGMIQSLGFAYHGMCACTGRVRSFRWNANGVKLEIKNHQSARFVQLYRGRIQILIEDYGSIEKFISDTQTIQRVIETGTS